MKSGKFMARGLVTERIFSLVFRGKGIFREKPSMPEYTGFEIGKTGIIPVLRSEKPVLYRFRY
jgi:hypothetical protein